MQPSQERWPPGTRRLPRRPTDRMGDAAAWVLTAAGLFVVLLGVFVGIDVHGTVRDLGRAAEQDRTRVEAVLVADPLPVHDPAATVLASRTARYTDPAGRQHEVVVTVSGWLPAGSVVPVWVDRGGNVVAAPSSGVDALVLGAALGLGVMIAGAAILFGMWVAVRRELDRRNAAGWAEDWARVEPQWSGRGR